MEQSKLYVKLILRKRVENFQHENLDETVQQRKMLNSPIYSLTPTFGMGLVTSRYRCSFKWKWFFFINNIESMIRFVSIFIAKKPLQNMVTLNKHLFVLILSFSSVFLLLWGHAFADLALHVTSWDGCASWAFPLVPLSRVSSSNRLAQAYSQGDCVEKDKCESRSCKGKPTLKSHTMPLCRILLVKAIAMAAQIQADCKSCKEFVAIFIQCSFSMLITLRKM